MTGLLMVLAQRGDLPAGVAVFVFVMAAAAVLAALAVWLWALIDAIRNPRLDDTMRIVWVLVIVLLQLLGAILYLFLGRRNDPPA